MTHPAVPAPLSPADAARRESLRRMRAVALGLLVVAAIVYIATRGHGGVWGYVNAGAEASMVGGVADWFAVTALFRHPLGVPVPHTAIIPRRKDQLAVGLEEFVSGNFLTPAIVREKVDSVDVARRTGVWLAEEAHAARVVAEITPAIRSVLRKVTDDDVADFFSRTILPRLRAEPLSPVAGGLLRSVVADQAHRGLVDTVAHEAYLWLLSNTDTVAKIMNAKTPWWSPRFVDDLVIERLQAELIKAVTDIRDNPEHPVRGAVDSYLMTLAGKLESDPETQAKAEALKERFLSDEQILPTVVRLWRVLRDQTIEALEDAEAPLRVRLVSSLTHLGQRLQEDEEFAQRVNDTAGTVVAGAVERYGPEVASVISGTISRWDGREASDKIELHTGRDLQFIRINGTVVGGLVGVLIHALSEFA